MVRLEIDIKEVELSEEKVYDFIFTFVVGEDATEGEKMIAQEIKETICECLYGYSTDTEAGIESKEGRDEEIKRKIQKKKEVFWN